MDGRYEKDAKIIISKYVNNKTRQLIGDFSILWNLYEKRVIENIKLMLQEQNVSQEQILEKIIENYKNKFFNKEKCIKEEIINEIEYNFKLLNEFLNKNGVSFSFYVICNFFNICNYSKKAISRLLNKNEELELFDKLHFFLIIIYRVRNNMFHGSKTIIKLNAQNDLFYVCNNIMSLILDDVENAIRNTGGI